MKRSLREIAEAVQARVVGDSSVGLSGISSIDSASPGTLVFVEDGRTFAAHLRRPRPQLSRENLLRR